MPVHLPRRRQALIALGALPLLAEPLAALAQGAPPREGSEFRSLPRAIPTDQPDKILVLDFFRYGCPHCFQFLPYLEAWERRMPGDVTLQRVPCFFGSAQLEPHSRIWFGLRALGREDLHRRVFEAIHVSRRPLDNPDDIADFMAANGIARDKWTSVYNAFSMAPALRRVHDSEIAYAIDGTPSIGVDGRFLTAPSMIQNPNSLAQAQETALAVTDYLIGRVRAEGKKRRG